MKACILAAIAAFLAVAFAGQLSEQQSQFLFTRFVDQYNKQYETSKFFKKYNTFKDNLNLVLAHNARDSTYKLAMNHFGDLNAEEFAALHKLKPVGALLRAQAASNTMVPSFRAPTDVDYTKYMNPVKNQGGCGSCWAFSTVGTIEGTINVDTGKLHNLSEQQLVDCSGSTGNEGCGGGLMDQAAEFVIANKGLCSADDYPYTAKDGSCKKCTPVATISSYQLLPSQTNAISDALDYAPVAVALGASSSAFQFYSSGIVTANCPGTEVNHAVIAVGRGTEIVKGKEVEYYKIRNSWGSGWGDKGYIRIQKGTNMCGVEGHNWNVRMLI